MLSCDQSYHNLNLIRIRLISTFAEVTEEKLVGACVEGGAGGERGVWGLSRVKTLKIEQYF